MTPADPQRDSDMSAPRSGLPRPPTPRRRAWRWWTVAVLVVVIAGVLAWRHWHAGAADAGAAPGAPGSPGGKGGKGGKGGRGGPGANAVMPVGVAVAKTANVNVYLEGLGSVTPRATVTVQAQIAGVLLRVLFKEGQMVKNGELLAEIDPRPYQAALEQAQGTLLRDQALLNAARVDLLRYQTLIKEDSIAQQTLDTQAALVKQDEGTVKTDQGAVEMARVNLSYTRITAPVAGRVGLRQVDAGNVIQPNSANGIVVITQLQPVDVIYTIPQDDIPGVVKAMASGQPVSVEAYDRDRKTLLGSGVLLTMDNQIDVTTGTVKLKATFPNDKLALFPNQFVNTHMLIDVVKSAIVVPGAAVQRGSIGTFAYVVKDDNTVTVRKVTLGPTEGDQVAVNSGVASGETVVIDGADKLKEGAKVEPVSRTAQGAGAPSPSAAPAGQKGGHHKREAASDSAPAAGAAPGGAATPAKTPD